MYITQTYCQLIQFLYSYYTVQIVANYDHCQTNQTWSAFTLFYKHYIIKRSNPATLELTKYCLFESFVNQYLELLFGASMLRVKGKSLLIVLYRICVSLVAMIKYGKVVVILGHMRTE